MTFLLIQNQNVVPGNRWIVRIPGEGQLPYIAQVREFQTESQAANWLANHDGLKVGDKPMAVSFAGVADNTRCPITASHFEEVEEFMQQAAAWLLSH